MIKNLKKIAVIAVSLYFLLFSGCEQNTADFNGSKGADDSLVDAKREAEMAEESVSVWQEQHLNLDKQYEQITVAGDRIYGCFEENGEVVLVCHNKFSGAIEKQITLPEVSCVQTMQADLKGNVYVAGSKGETCGFWKIDTEGNLQEIEELILEDTESADYITPKGIFTLEEGYFYVWYEMGIPLTEILPDAEKDVFVVVDRIYVKDAQFHTIFYEQIANRKGSGLLSFQVDATGKSVIMAKDTEGIYIQTINLEHKKLGEQLRLDEKTELAEMTGNIAMKDDGFLFCQGSSLYEFFFETRECEKILDLSSYGIFPSDILYMGINGDTIEIVDNYMELQMSEFTTLKKGENSKRTLTLGTMQVSHDLERAVTNFNRYHEKIRVEMISYYDEQKGFEAGLDQLRLDIIRGEAPDILEVSVIAYETLAEKGFLVDLYECMQGDAECSRDMLMPSVIEAYEVNNQLFCISPAFQLYSIWGKNSVIQNRSGVTLEDLMQILKSNGKSLNAITGFSADEPVLTTLCTFGMDEFVDWDHGTCDFEGEYFQKILQFAKEYQGGYVEGSVSRGIREGEIVMSVGMIASVADYQIQSKLYEGDLSFIGYPTEKSSGTAVGFRGSQLAINARKENQSAAWEFVKYYLLHGYDGEGFPTVKSQFDAEMEKAIEKDFVTTSEGTYETAKGTYYDGDIYIEVFEAGQEDIRTVTSLVEQASNSFKYNTEILNIINEESVAYFAGQKDEQETAAFIQNRVALYLQEQMN